MGSAADLSQLIVSASADGIVAVDDQGTLRLCNPAAAALFARSVTELVGTSFGYPLADAVTEINLILPDGGTRVVEMRVTSALWNDSRLHIAALRDVTRRRELEHELEAALEHRDVAVAMAAHELRNPLAAIAVLVDILRDRQARLTEVQRAEMLDGIAERTARLQALVRKLLISSRIDARGAPATLEAVPVLEFLLEQVAELKTGAREVRLSCSPDLVALVDRAEFAEMLANYLENAATYGRPPTEIRAARLDDHIEVRVSDAGPGVPDAFVPRLFDRFTREPLTERDTEGTGLGLWIVRSLARSNGGEAWYEPAGNGGSCFVLRLQRADDNAMNPARSLDPPPQGVLAVGTDDDLDDDPLSA